MLRRLWLPDFKPAQHLCTLLQPNADRVTVAAGAEGFHKAPARMLGQQGVAQWQDDAQVERVAALEETREL